MRDNSDNKEHAMSSGGIIGVAIAVLGTASLVLFNKINKMRDEHHYDEDGYDEDGYDRNGLDRDGFDRDGFNQDGFDRNGFNRQGYNKQGYNVEGIDRAGKDSEYYKQEFIKLRQKLSSAKNALDKEEYTHAIIDSRQSFEHALTLLISHKKGSSFCKDGLFDNLKICEKYKIINDAELLKKLHDIRLICKKVHDIDADQELTHKTVYFVVMQLNDFFDSIEDRFLNI